MEKIEIEKIKANKEIKINEENNHFKFLMQYLYFQNQHNFSPNDNNKLNFQTLPTEQFTEVSDANISFIE